MRGYLLALNTIGITLLRISDARAAILIDSQLTHRRGSITKSKYSIYSTAGRYNWIRSYSLKVKEIVL